MKRVLVSVGVAAVIAALLAVWLGGREPVLEDAFVRGHRVTVWNRVAQLREPVATLSYGDRVGILERRESNVRIRAADGDTGWVSESYLVPLELWDRGTQLLTQTRPMPVQGRGRTKVTSNIRIGPGRDEPRLFQFTRGVPVEVLARAVADVPASPTSAEDAAGAAPAARREDWALVRATTDDSGEIAGWMVARFIEPDVPDMVGSLTTGLRFTAWFELGRVADPGSPDASGRAHILILGSTGPEGQACDFTVMRVYTWSVKNRRYETSFVDSTLCGKLPVAVKVEASGAEISFVNTSRRGEEQRLYQMRQTVVRRLRQPPR